MANDELLALPHVLEVAANDPEDVSWALSTAGAMWARGEHAEGLRWIRKAAEAAADAEADVRALELAKAASDLASSMDRPPANTAQVKPEKAAHSAPPSKARSAPPLPPASVKARSAPPLPPSAKTRSTPPTSGSNATPSSKSQSAGAPVAKTPSSAPKTPRGSRRPAATSDAPSSAKGRPSRSSAPPAKRECDSGSDETFVGSFEELAAKRAADGDASLAHTPGRDQPVASGNREIVFDSGRKAKAAVAASATHDPEIRTSQAARVVVWRDGTGVHVAPAGTVVSAITVDAVLVALEPEADLTAWLSSRVK